MFKTIKNAIAEYKRSQELDRELERSLIDPTLLDRMSRVPTHIPVRGEQEPEEVRVRILHRPKSLDGILGAAV
jgi:hypothetical protein